MLQSQEAELARKKEEMAQWEADLTKKEAAFKERSKADQASMEVEWQNRLSALEQRRVRLEADEARVKEEWQEEERRAAKAREDEAKRTHRRHRSRARSRSGPSSYSRRRRKRRHRPDSSRSENRRA